MPQAVRFDEYGGVDVLRVVEVDRPVPGPGQVLVRVKAAGINPGEAKIRQGLLAQHGRPRFRPGRAATWPAWWRNWASASPGSRSATR